MSVVVAKPCSEAQLVHGVSANRRGEFLELEYSASEPYSSFVYSTPEMARQIAGLLFDQGAAEFASQHARLLMVDGQLVGIFVALTSKELLGARLKALGALRRSGSLDNEPSVTNRIQLAGRTLLKPQPGDLYLSRIAVSPKAQGRGWGRQLMNLVLEHAFSVGTSRIVLEVSPTSSIALALYERAGFVRLSEQTANDPVTGRTLTYCHMGLQIERMTGVP